MGEYQSTIDNNNEQIRKRESDRRKLDRQQQIKDLQEFIDKCEADLNENTAKKVALAQKIEDRVASRTKIKDEEIEKMRKRQEEVALNNPDQARLDKIDQELLDLEAALNNKASDAEFNQEDAEAEFRKMEKDYKDNLEKEIKYD